MQHNEKIKTKNLKVLFLTVGIEPGSGLMNTEVNEIGKYQDLTGKKKKEGNDKNNEI